jgi:hypothetical protein
MRLAAYVISVGSFLLPAIAHAQSQMVGDQHSRLNEAQDQLDAAVGVVQTMERAGDTALLKHPRGRLTVEIFWS